LIVDWGFGDPSTDNYATNITSLTLGGLTATCHRDLAPVFSHLITEITGWGVNLGSVAYGYDGAPTVNSWHSVGAAIDLDPERNPVGQKVTTFPIRKTQALCEDLGLTWGRDWEPSPSPAHFEISHPLSVMRHIANRLRQADGTRPPLRRSLSQGDFGEPVRWSQERLAVLGYYDGPIHSRFTWEMQRAVRRWQGAHNLRVNGTITSAAYDSLQG
jgi:hypothetical protein